MRDDVKPLAEADQQRLDDLYRAFQTETSRFVGYPCSALFDYTPLFKFLAFPANNVGDAYLPSNYRINTHEIEREVITTFAQLTRAPADAHWGYVTGGGTEGNMYGIFLARELFPEGVVYYSEDTHYSVNKILRCLYVRNIMIRSDPDGRVNLDDLRETIKIHRDVPPIIFANIGTTMKGAIDDVRGMRRVMEELGKDQYYIHADAAFSGMILPFVDDAEPWDFAPDCDEGNGPICEGRLCRPRLPRPHARGRIRVPGSSRRAALGARVRLTRRPPMPAP